MYFTKESNILLSFWRQILDFKHDFANLRSSTEKDLSSFKVCICQNIQNITDLQNLSDHGVGEVFYSIYCHKLIFAFEYILTNSYNI